MLPKLRVVGKDDTGTPWKELAEIFGRLRSIIAASWRLEEALSMACVQVQICLGLANAQLENTSPDLAASFVDLTECLRDLRLPEEACATVAQAVYHYRRLAQSSPSLLPLLASSLRLESKCRRDLCDHDGAYDVIVEAIEIQRGIPRDPSETCNTALLASLNHASMCLSSLHRYPEALEAAEEAVATLRKSSGSTFGPLRPILAVSLQNLSSVLSEMENHKYALRAAQEAVDLQSQPALQDNDVLHVELAAFHAQLAIARSQLKDVRGTVAASQAAVDELRPAVECSEIFNSDLACHLNLLSGYLRANQEYQRALEMCEEAVQIQRRLASRFPQRHNANLVAYLDTLSQCHWKLKDHMKALQVVDEAFGIHTSRSLRENAALALLLHHKSLYCTELGRLNDARETSKEAIKVQRDQFNITPTNTKLKSALAEMENHLSAIKSRDGAYEAINSGRLAWGGSPPPDVTRTDMWRAGAAFYLVCISAPSFVFGSLFLGPVWGAAVAVGILEGSYMLSWYNTGSPSTGFYVCGFLLIGCVAMQLMHVS